MYNTIKQSSNQTVNRKAIEKQSKSTMAFQTQTLNVKASVVKALEECANEVLRESVKSLSTHFNFDYDEAMSLLGVLKLPDAKPSGRKEKSVKVSKPAVLLPWTGEIKEEWCYGVRPSHGLFNQCTNVPMVNKGDGDLYGKLCSTCLKQCEKNTHGKPNGGLVIERNEACFKSPSGKSPVVYSVVMKKLDIKREAAMEEAAKFGLTIPECEFEMVEKKRGRPAKEEEAEQKEPKKRGRPAKPKRQVSISTAEELLSELEEQGAAVEKKTRATKEVKPESAEEEVSDNDVDYEPETLGNGLSSDSESGEESGEEECDVVPVMINETEYYMLEEEAEKNGCDVMDESGDVVGVYKKIKTGGSIVKKSSKKSKSVKK